ncbi:MAG: dihydrofolate reductase family protein [Chitinophagales bacterium]
MRKIKLYIAISIDGYIAQSDGGVAWLDEVPNPDQTDYGYFDFYKSIDTTLMGNATYQQIRTFDIPFPYPDKVNYVFSRKEQVDNEDVRFVRKNAVDFVEELQSQKGGDIWLIGGGQLNAVFLKYGLIDEMIVSIMPIVLGSGIPLFAAQDIKDMFTLKKVVSFQSGVVQTTYKKIENPIS